MPSCWNISLPDTWSCGAISSVCVKTKMRDPSKNPDEEFLYVDVSSVSNESFTITSSTPTQGAEAPSRARKAIETDDVLYATVRPYLKRVAKVPSDLNGQIASTGFCVIRADKQKASPDYLYYLLLTEQVNSRIRDLQKGSSYPAVSDKEVVGQLVPLPNIIEQRSIATVLAKIQEAISAQQEIIDRTRELKKALMAKLFTEGLLGEPTKETDIGLIPKSWQLKSVKELASKITKGSSPNWQGFEYCEEGIIFVRSQNVGFGEFDFESTVRLPEGFNEKEKRSILKAEDVLINLVGASIGRVAVAPVEVDGGNINQAVALVRLHTDKCLPNFLECYLLTDSGQTQIRLQQKEIARANISLQDVQNFLIPIPPSIEEQLEIVTSLKGVSEKIRLSEIKKAIFEDFFKTMLDKLMTGNIRITSLMEA